MVKKMKLSGLQVSIGGGSANWLPMDYEIMAKADEALKARFGPLAHVSAEVRQKLFNASSGEFGRHKEYIEKRIKELRSSRG